MTSMLQKYADSLISPAYQATLDWLKIRELEKDGKEVPPDLLKRAQAPVQPLRDLYRNWDFGPDRDEDKGAFAGELNRAFFLGDTEDNPLFDSEEGDLSWMIVKIIVGEEQLGVLNAMKQLANWTGVKVNELTVKSATELCWSAIDKFRKPADNVGAAEEEEEEEAATDADASADVKLSKFLAHMTKTAKRHVEIRRKFAPHKHQRRNFTRVLEWIERKEGRDAAELREKFEATRNPRAGKSPNVEKPARKPKTQHETTTAAPAKLTLSGKISAMQQAIDAIYAEADGIRKTDRKAANAKEQEAAPLEEQLTALKAEQAAEAAQAAAAKAASAGPSLDEQIAAMQQRIKVVYAEADKIRDGGDRKAANAKELEAEPLEAELSELKAKAEQEVPKGPSLAEQIATKQAEIDAIYAEADGIRKTDRKAANAKEQEAAPLEEQLTALKAKQAPVAAAPAPKAEAASNHAAVPTSKPAAAPQAPASPAGNGRVVMSQLDATKIVAGLDEKTVDLMFENLSTIAANGNEVAASIITGYKNGNYRAKPEEHLTAKGFVVVRGLTKAIIQSPASAAAAS